MQQDGVRVNQVTQVRGYADQMLRMKNNPTDPSNRRVSILVKNDNESVPTLSAASVVDGSTPLPGAAQPLVPAASGAKPQAAQPATQATKPAAPATAPASAASAPTSKPPAGTPAAKSSLIDRLKNMLPGKKSSRRSISIPSYP
jgi:chemotaxis protein MotB